MRLVLAFLLLLPFSVYASKILSYNIYERTDRADVMITFDTPYHGKIRQSKGKSKITLKLEDASIESSKVKKVNSAYLKSLLITPMGDYTQIVAITPKNVHIIASKTADGYGLRLRFTDKRKTTASTTTSMQGSEANSLSNLPTKKGNEFTTSYYIVVGVLIIGIVILFVLKKKIQKQTPNNAPAQNSWLFKDTPPQNAMHPTPNESPQTVPNAPETDQITIRFQKKLDPHNSVVMLDFLQQSYLVIIGNGNILLDKFTDNKPNSQSEFEAILQERHSELEEFLDAPQGNATKTSTLPNSFESSLNTYKERAATLAYKEE